MARKPKATPPPDAFVLDCAAGTFTQAAPGKYLKAVLKAGHTVEREDGKTLEITPELLATMAESTNRFIANGGKVPAPAGPNPHAKADDADSNRGWWDGAFVREGTLFLTLSPLVDEPEEYLKRTDVSVYALSKFKDTKGEQYEWPLLHIALTPTPRVTDLGGFVKIAASGREVPVFRLAQEQPMDAWKKVAAELGLNIEGKSDAEIESACIEKIKAMKGGAAESANVAASLKTAQDEIVALKAGRRDPEPLPPLVIKLARENRGIKLNGLVERAKISPAVRDRMAAKFVPTDEVALSRALQPDVDALFDTVVAALEENDPVKLGEQTRAQTVVASRTVPGAGNTIDPKQNDAYMAERIKGVQPAKVN